MGFLFKKYKTKFRYALQPLFAMLVAKREQLPPDEWVEMVSRTKNSILNNPLEYLSDDLPEKSLMNDILDEIFYEFLKDKNPAKKKLVI